jgi:hypothetical protein
VLRRNDVKVIIMKCDKADFWYKNSVGKTFKVLREDNKRYYTKTKNSKTLVPILKADCEAIER